MAITQTVVSGDSFPTSQGGITVNTGGLNFGNGVDTSVDGHAYNVEADPTITEDRINQRIQRSTGVRIG